MRYTEKRERGKQPEKIFVPKLQTIWRENESLCMNGGSTADSKQTRDWLSESCMRRYRNMDRRKSLRPSSLPLSGARAKRPVLTKWADQPIPRDCTLSNTDPKKQKRNSGICLAQIGPHEYPGRLRAVSRNRPPRLSRTGGAAAGLGGSEESR